MAKRTISQWLLALHDIAKSINSSLDIQAVQALILDEAAGLMHARHAVLFLLAPDGRTLVCRGVRDLPAAGLVGREFATVASFAHCIVRRGAVITLGELLSPADAADCRRTCAALMEMFYAPLEVQGEAYGLLGVSGEPHAFSMEELELFCLLASQASVALENAALYERLREAYEQTTTALAEAINSRDPYTGGHIRRVRDYAARLGDALGLAGEARETLRIAAILHDVGKLGIPDSILGKATALDAEEQRLMRRHPEIGARILAGVAHLTAARQALRHHHEWFDGSGYPDGLAGEAIPVTARIIAIADAYDALTTERPYSPAESPEAALASLRRGAGTQFDPHLVARFAQTLAAPRPDETP